MSLARSFFQARASAVVGSLWPLRDRDSGALMDAFYRRLSRGDTVPSALAEAKRDRIRAGAPAAAWAGVVLLGAGDHAPWPEGAAAPGAVGGVLLVGGLLAIATLLVLRHRRGT